MVNVTPVQGLPDMYNFINDSVVNVFNPLTIVIFLFIIVIYYTVAKYFKRDSYDSDGGASSSVGMIFIEILMWAMFLFIVLMNGLQYFFNVDVQAGIKGWFSDTPSVDIKITSDLDKKKKKKKKTAPSKQVFNLSDNKYTYDDAKAVCKAYGAELADYKQVEEAHKGGAEWCGFGWSKDKMALFPTQTKSWDKLQNTPGHERDCGRPGINGGYVCNKGIRYGVNCYGIKPDITLQEKNKLEDGSPRHIVTRREMQFKRKINSYKKNLADIFVSPFNYDKWSQV
tara:strand:- start:27 stop:875 length:849 start_codon:yes stop_codon:yes gene_type:complete